MSGRRSQGNTSPARNNGDRRSPQPRNSKPDLGRPRQAKSNQARPNQAKPRRKKSAPVDVLEAVPPAQRDRVALRLRNATDDFQAGRFGDADAILSQLERSYPQEPQIIELYALTQYRTGQWKKAAEALEILIDLTGSIDQLPIVADCYRALGDIDRVRSLWDELRMASPTADATTEGRIVMAGALADSGDLAGAIRLLENGPVRTSVVRDRHLRIWYALADLYDRAGETQRARRVFSRIVEVDASYYDAADRLASL